MRRFYGCKLKIKQFFRPVDNKISLAHDKSIKKKTKLERHNKCAIIAQLTSHPG